MSKPEQSPGRAELAAALKAIRGYFIQAGLYSAAVNLLMLVPILYMLQVYDRVISSGSLSTLTMLTLLLVFLLAAMGIFEWVRSTILIGASNRIEQGLRDRVFDATFKRALLTGGANNSAQPINDLSSLRQFLTGNGVFAFFDAPWYPIYVAIMFMFHFWFGVAAILAGIVMVTVAVLNEYLTNRKLQEANQQAAWLANQVNSSMRNAEVIGAMGMTQNIRKRQQIKANEVLVLQTEASRTAGKLTSFSKTFRITAQSLVLGLGALLAVRQEISPGMMIAGSLLLGRALAPIDMLVGSWKGFSVARAQYDRLAELLGMIPPDAEKMQLPKPEGAIHAEELAVAPPGARKAVVQAVNFQLAPGEAMGIVGPSGCGKSSLARTLLGIWKPVSGAVRLDGADISEWDRDDLGPYVGYLPQDIELFEGTISENICRFGNPDSNAIVEAARLAGVHDMILHFPKGYDTIIGSGGGTLSGGQRQRLGLARALYHKPRLVVLDEPNSNLDDQGERELVEALKRVTAQGTTVVLITHRLMILKCVDKILALKDGTPLAFGPRDQVLAELSRQAAARVPEPAS